MWHIGRRSAARAVGVMAAGLICLPTAAFAQTAPGMLVQRTPNYTLVLDVGPVETMVSPMDAISLAPSQSWTSPSQAMM